MKLRTEKTSFWIDIEIGGATCRLEVSPLSSGEIRKIIKTHSKQKFLRGQATEETDELEVRLERFDKTVLNWEGITDLEDKPLPCNGETKRAIAEYNHDFVLQIFEKVDDINIALNSAQAKSKKK
ncbi:MAG: hypothetical protein A2527_11830 [Candidatus Lambdaproteobacteria bacterium RIFOXYD2_FULL_50_16]|uniref:Uncharacterized protein n=1 Tax=Candidatus Lambdaproteobacteria bacterium RIFOXYD2_FULL_50_16 TaxID=1817772 RepID=A0A1F6G648_9PROT|nr:MAG: hypothetical protein A2527_11830 [Candidatus Lambdaproteobacteria bacterium RIFOXYD2_FULL_50_16]